MYSVDRKCPGVITVVLRYCYELADWIANFMKIWSELGVVDAIEKY